MIGIAFYADLMNLLPSLSHWLIPFFSHALPLSSLFPPSLCTTLCLQWEPKAIAVAFLYLAGKMAKFDMQAATQSRSKYWWRVFLDTLDVHDLDGQ